MICKIIHPVRSGPRLNHPGRNDIAHTEAGFGFRGFFSDLCEKWPTRTLNQRGYKWPQTVLISNINGNIPQLDSQPKSSFR